MSVLRMWIFYGKQEAPTWCGVPFIPWILIFWEVNPGIKKETGKVTGATSSIDLAFVMIDVQTGRSAIV